MAQASPLPNAEASVPKTKASYLKLPACWWIVNADAALESLEEPSVSLSTTDAARVSPKVGSRMSVSTQRKATCLTNR